MPHHFVCVEKSTLPYLTLPRHEGRPSKNNIHVVADSFFQCEQCDYCLLPLLPVSSVCISNHRNEVWLIQQATATHSMRLIQDTFKMKIFKSRTAFGNIKQRKHQHSRRCRRAGRSAPAPVPPWSTRRAGRGRRWLRPASAAWAAVADQGLDALALGYEVLELVRLDHDDGWAHRRLPGAARGPFRPVAVGRL